MGDTSRQIKLNELKNSTQRGTVANQACGAHRHVSAAVDFFHSLAVSPLSGGPTHPSVPTRCHPAPSPSRGSCLSRKRGPRAPAGPMGWRHLTTSSGHGAGGQEKLPGRVRMRGPAPCVARPRNSSKDSVGVSQVARRYHLSI